ncbi:MAG: TolC family protein, partial [Nitrospiraceae bacterium]
SHSYSLNDIVTLALERNPAMAGAAAAVRQSRGERAAAGAYLNPSITGSGGRGAIRDPSTGVSIIERTVTVEQPLELPGKRRARQRAADATLAGAQAGVEDTRLNLLSEVKVAFYQLLLAQRDVELSLQNLSTTQDIFQTIKARVDAGQARPFEAVKANVELQKADKELSRAQNSLVVARVRVDVLTAGALGKKFSVAGDFSSFPQELALDELTARSLESHPILRRLTKRIQQAEHSIVQERESRIPYITISGTYHREAGDEAYLAGLSVPIPLWYRRQGEIEAALGAKDRAEAERVHAQNQLVSNITEQVQGARTARQQIDVFEKGLLKQAEEALRIARISFKQGAAGLLDLIDAQRVYRQMLLEYAQARADMSVALARLERWAGELP